VALPRPASRLRALLVGPVVEAAYVGGLQLALQNVADELRMRGWQVDAPLYLPSIPIQENNRNMSLRGAPFATKQSPAEPGLSSRRSDARNDTHIPQSDYLNEAAKSQTLQSTQLQTSLSIFQRWPALLEIRKAIPEGFRQSLSAAFAPQAFLDNASHNLAWLEARLADPTQYDLVLICPDYNTPGALALAAERHPRVVVISLAGLVGELRPTAWRAVRWLIGARMRGRQHPFLFQPIQPPQIKAAVFASTHWQAKAVQARLSASVAHTIYFGIPLPAPLPRPAQIHNRLLWVGRLTPEKGLHHILAALPGLRQRFPDLKFTAIAGQGEADYRQAILDLIQKLNLSDVVSLQPPVERAALQQAYAEHDLLCFYSVIAEPVALVLMEAYAAGLPVVANPARYDSILVADGQTCLCYQPTNPQSLATAITRLLSDSALRTKLSHNAQTIVRDQFSLAAMGDAYDTLLREMALTDLKNLD
jgi:glycosyltransferase involved in cell wall biosynthesis